MNKKNQAPKVKLPRPFRFKVRYIAPEPLKIKVTFYQDAVVLRANREAFFSSAIGQFQKFAPVYELFTDAKVKVNDCTKRRLRR